MSENENQSLKLGMIRKYIKKHLFSKCFGYKYRERWLCHLCPDKSDCFNYGILWSYDTVRPENMRDFIYLITEIEEIHKQAEMKMSPMTMRLIERIRKDILMGTLEPYVNNSEYCYGRYEKSLTCTFCHSAEMCLNATERELKEKGLK